jgi:3-keto-disaccharide hydrolase
MKLQLMCGIAMIVMGLSLSASAQEQIGYEVHDGRRPQPTVITPGTFGKQDQPGKPPSDAIVLFDGKDLSNWESVKGGDAPWKVVDGDIENVPGSGDIQTRQQFGDVQLHVEWLEPQGTTGRSQERGNSGVILQGLYEMQVLDNYKSETYADGMAGAIYGQYPPLVNPSRPQGEWQIYDIIFHAAKLQAGKVVRPARMTAFFNGVLVQDDSDLLGPTGYQILATYPASLPDKGPLRLQDHTSPIRYRNIWVRSLLAEKPQPPIKPAGQNDYEKMHH